jgi:hypothetical protein
MQQRQASPHTIGSYRDSFRLLLAASRSSGSASRRRSLAFEQVDAPLIAAFLDDSADRPWYQRHQPQPAADRHSLVLPLFASFEMPSHAAHRSSACWPSRTSAAPARRSASSPARRPTHSFALRTCTRSLRAGATTRSCCWRFRQGCACRSSQALRRHAVCLGTGRPRARSRQGPQGTSDAADQGSPLTSCELGCGRSKPVMTRSYFPAREALA